ncbi:hypothetical protein D9615_001425 [Tricholomella constricta]|uniref:Uncharacterized protein n=1 Tax=Tricholomella constricta TaxID=117010 RepID=A0A8H5HK38_9AGAR|nr:hypothetical protein D9615_001425 [Tricholomella constricta]
MALQRSKSAPHGVPALVPAPTRLQRASSFHTIQQAVKPVKAAHMAAIPERAAAEREDPFSLSGFFPSSLREDKWGWLRDEEKVEKKRWTAEDGGHGGVLFGESDKLTREVIKGEDKMGVLSLGGLLTELEGELRTSYGAAMGGDGEREAMDGEREAMDEDSLWLALRLRRGTTLPEMPVADAEHWKTPVDSAIDEYFPIWDIQPGNSRGTKLPHVA